MPRAEEAKKKIMVVLRFMVIRTQDTNVKRSYKMIQKGYGDIDTLQDIIAGVSLIKSHSEYLSQVRPGGIEVTLDYLEESKKLALELVAMRGDVTAAADDTSVYVDRQNRLLTLCIKVQREIKLFADIAYYNDQDRYDRYYASDRLREIRLDHKNNADDTEDLVNSASSEGARE